MMGSETGIVLSRLGQLAEEIQAEVAAAEADLQSAVQHAVNAGEKLTDAKKLVTHGEWLPWLEANFQGSQRTAQNYMRLAENAQRVAHLPTVRDAIATLTESRSDAEQATIGLSSSMTREDALTLTAEVKSILDDGLGAAKARHLQSVSGVDSRRVQHAAIEGEMRDMFLNGDWPEGVRGTPNQNIFMWAAFCIMLGQLEQAGAYDDFGYDDFDAYAKDRLRDVLLVGRTIEQAAHWEVDSA